MMKVIYPIMQKPLYRREPKPQQQTQKPKQVKINGVLRTTQNGAAGLPPTVGDMSDRSSDRRQVPVTLPRLRFMENPCGIRTAEHTLKRMMGEVDE